MHVGFFSFSLHTKIRGAASLRQGGFKVVCVSSTHSKHSKRRCCFDGFDKEPYVHDMELSPKFIAVSLGLVLIVTTTQYFFDTSWSTSKASVSSKKNVSYYYGPPNAEFDWCEENYEVSDYVAEFVNTLTGFLYFLPGIFGVAYHQGLSVHSKLLLFFISCIGVGTVLFHCSLQYSAQLVDELPIYYVILTGNFMLWYRGSEGNTKVAWALCAWAGGLSALLLGTPREYWLHTVGRGTMSCTFSILFGYIFSATAGALKEIRGLNADRLQRLKDLFHMAFFEFVFAIACWILDNARCDLVLGNPLYPVTAHALWHVFTSIGLYKMFLVLEFIHVNKNSSGGLELIWLAWGLPVLVQEGRAKAE